jgi:hypothetical protein
MANTLAVEVDRTTIEIERIIEFARDLRSSAQNISGRLYDIRSRLLGLGEPKCAAASSVKEVVTSEIHDLRGTLDDLNSAMIDANQYLADIEGI